MQSLGATVVMLDYSPQVLSLQANLINVYFSKIRLALLALQLPCYLIMAACESRLLPTIFSHTKILIATVLSLPARHLVGNYCRYLFILACYLTSSQLIVFL